MPVFVDTPLTIDSLITLLTRIRTERGNLPVYLAVFEAEWDEYLPLTWGHVTVSNDVRRGLGEAKITGVILE